MSDIPNGENQTEHNLETNRNNSWSILKYFYSKDKLEAIDWLSNNNN